MKDAMSDFQDAINRYCNSFPCTITPKAIKSVSPDFKLGIVTAIATGSALDGNGFFFCLSNDIKRKTIV